MTRSAISGLFNTGEQLAGSMAGDMVAGPSKQPAAIRFAVAGILRRAGIACALVGAWASTAAQADSSSEFVARYECHLVNLFEAIHAHRPIASDRFMVLSPADAPEKYVQCLFFDGDTKLICEAASGFYMGRSRTLFLNDGQLSALAGLGFSIAEDRGNYRQTLDIVGASGISKAARTLLSALRLVYGASADVPVIWKAPLAPGRQGQLTECELIG